MPEHVKVPDITPITRYVANGTQTDFSYPFPIFASEDLAVYIDGARQASGYTINGAGQSMGGSVTFDTAPAMDSVLTFARELAIERITDFLEGGDFSAQSINNELDYMVAALQQVSLENTAMLRYSDNEAPAKTELPARNLRANKGLGFDGNGNPIALDLSGAAASPDFTASGTGASTRTVTDKLGDAVSVKDFGAKGDGLTNDTIAIQNALAANDSVFLPAGEYLISGTITITARKALIGAGQKSVLK